MPQASSMSTILWLLYTAPMFDDVQLPYLDKHNTDFTPFKHADDVAIAVSSNNAHSYQDVMQGLLDHGSSFCQRSCITLHASKSAQIVISTSYKCRVILSHSFLMILVVHKFRLLDSWEYINAAMNFSKQCLAERRRVEQRLNIIRVTCGHSWGLRQGSSQRFIATETGS